MSILEEFSKYDNRTSISRINNVVAVDVKDNQWLLTTRNTIVSISYNSVVHSFLLIKYVSWCTDALCRIVEQFIASNKYWTVGRRGVASYCLDTHCNFHKIHSTKITLECMLFNLRNYETYFINSFERT